MSKTKAIKTEDEIKRGGVFSISQYDLETMSNEFTEISNILALAKADDGIKKLLLIEVIREFGDDITDLMDRLPIITEKKLDTILEGIVEVANEEIDFDGCHSDDLIAYINLPADKKEKEKAWIKKVLIG